MREIRRRRRAQSRWVERIDNFISIISPRWALRRRLARTALDYAFTSYRGAEKDRTKGEWLPGSGSADEDLLNELPILRERSRDLNRNDPHAAGLTESIIANVIERGIRPQSRIDGARLGLSDELTEELRSQAETIWRRWTPVADAGGRLSFEEIQALVLRQVLESGEALLLPVRLSDADRPYYLALDIIEPDRLATPPSQRQNRSIRSGVEIGGKGEPIAYWIKKTHPGDTRSRGYRQDDYIRIPAKDEKGRPNVLHIYRVLRPGQTRGCPIFAPALAYFKHLDSYLEAELVGARVAACLAAFIKTSEPYGAAVGRATDTDSRDNRVEALEPGMIEYLLPGEEIRTIVPNPPGNTFSPFVERVLRAVGSALGMPYEIVAKDFSRTNYSSARAALLEARRIFKTMQAWIAAKLCQPVWELLLEEAYLRDQFLEAKLKLRTTVPDFYEHREEYTRARWIAPGWSWVDPTKEVQAARLALLSHLTTLADEAAAQGKDYEEVLEQQAREQKKIDALGLPHIPEKQVRQSEEIGNAIS